MEQGNDRPIQFNVVDALLIITIVAGVIGLWRYESEVNPDQMGQGGVLLQLMRSIWNTAFVTNCCLIVWARLRMRPGADTRRQWRQLLVLSLPQLTFFALVLVGMGLGPDYFAPLRVWFSVLWLATCISLFFLLYGLTVEAVSPPHRLLHLAALTSAAVAACAPCCF